MKILALELSSRCGSVAYVDDESVVFDHAFANDRKHSGAFFETITAARAEYDRAELIVVGLGPGSYAGIRIAVSAAIGLNAALDAQMLGLPSICAMQVHEEEFFVVGDARRHSFFCATIVNGE